MATRDIIVIGASAGGVEALMKLVHELSADLPASVFLVLHIPPGSPSMLPQILSRSGPLPVTQPGDGSPIERQHIYVAPPDRHMILEENTIRIVRGPEENRHRPAIDPLFRSAALVYGPQVIGVILTGALDDGTAGLMAIKKRGGMAIVQNPGDALYPSMPQSALTYVKADHVLPLAKIGPQLSQLAHEHITTDAVPPVNNIMQQEVGIVSMKQNAFHTDDPVGEPSVFSCPECGGVLWEVHEGDLTRFRCRTGHAFSPKSIQEAQDERVENSLWVALKTLQEKASFSRRMANRAYEHHQVQLARDFELKIQEIETSVDTISSLLRKGLFAGTEKDVE